MIALVRSGSTLAVYVVINMAIAVVWHLVLFKETLEAATPFARAKPIIPLGMAAMVVQGVLLIWLYPRFHRQASPAKSGLLFGALAGLFLASGAIWVEVGKFQFADSITYLVLETIYEVVSFAALGLVIALRHKGES
jgi:hypothetical protein